MRLPMNTGQEEIWGFQKRAFSLTLWCSVMLGSVFLLMGEKAIAKGLVLGVLFSIVNSFLMGRFLPMTLDRSRGKASGMAMLSILCRYPILAIPIVWAVKSAVFSLPAVVVGLFSVQIVTLVDHLIRPMLAKR